MDRHYVGLVVDDTARNICYFTNRTVVEYLCARYIAVDGCTSIQKLPFKSTCGTTWLLLVDIVKQREKDEDSNLNLTLDEIIEAIQKQECWKEENGPPLRLLSELTLALGPEKLLKNIPKIFYKRIAEVCGEFGAFDTLKWLMENSVSC